MWLARSFFRMVGASERLGRDASFVADLCLAGRRGNLPQMRKKWMIPVGLIAGLAAGGWFWRTPIQEVWTFITHKVELNAGRKFRPDPKQYVILKNELEKWRLQLAERHEKAKNEQERLAVEHDARVILEQMLPSLMRCWLGTPWDFHGTAEGPGVGKIACGYFVSTVLKDAGFNVDRYRLAQQPSGNILQTFLSKKECSLTIGQKYESFTSGLTHREQGIYIVGLDSHVAFLVNDGAGFHFIHSSGAQPWCVVDEEKKDAHVLQRSNWRMIGNLTSSDDVIRVWLKGSRISVKM